jgi:hypothetical protein
MLMTEDERDMVFELATVLCGALVVNYERDDFRDSPIIDRIAQVAAMMKAHEQQVPPIIREVLRKAADAGRPIGTGLLD